ncbi:MAG: polysaccharide biosynthesis protein [Coriobacteriales bacterium]|jgi:FlaA1/EpsC-like NDP-sugar epimerase|nr:polysaccharide biosynthesis protein [Coriobacteriales bacterium]
MNTKLAGRTAFLIMWDVFVTYLAYVLATFGTRQTADIFATTDFLFLFGIAAIINVATFLFFRLYSSLWEYASMNELMQLVYATALATFISALVHFLAGPDARLPIRVYFVAWVLFLFFAGVARFAFRFYRRSKGIIDKRPPENLRRRTLIIGAGETGSLTINRMVEGDYAMQGLPVVAVDDDSGKVGHRIHGVKVVGTTDEILKLVNLYQIEQIVIAIPSASAIDRKRIYDICIQTNCRLLTLPNVRELRMDELDDVRLREVELTDLLGREEVVLNTRLVSGYLAGKTVLITGGGGSIGSELVRQIATVAPKQIVVFDIYENTTYELELEMRDRYDDMDFHVEIGSIRDETRTEAIFAQYRPDVVFHAAAHKHVPLMEANPREAILNNVFGTFNVARMADAYHAKNFIFISTDKAVNPTSVMGATKRLGETIVQHFAQGSQTCFTAVRFGNVLGSHGSVIPMFKRQIAEGGPITITHPDITRYFMTIPEASRLVVQAGGMAKGGEIFILDMGEQVKIVDLARKMIRLSGLAPDVDIKIEFVGLRPGEKLYEELLMDCEQTLSTSVKSIMISTGEEDLQEDILEKLARLRKCVDQDAGNEEMKACLREQVPTYRGDVSSLPPQG